MLRELIRRAQEKDKQEQALRECTFTPKKVSRDPTHRKLETTAEQVRRHSQNQPQLPGRRRDDNPPSLEDEDIREILGRSENSRNQKPQEARERSRPTHKASFERTFYERNKQWDLDRQNKIDIVRLSKDHLPESYTFKPETTQYNPSILHEYPRELKDSNYMQEALASYYGRMERARNKPTSMTPNSRRSNSNSKQRSLVVGPPSCLEERCQARKSVEARREKLKEKVVSKYQKKRIQLHDQLMQTSMFK